MAIDAATIRVASVVPGRLRLRGAPLRDAAMSARLAARLSRWHQVSAVEANPRTGSLLILYKAELATPAAFCERIRKALAPIAALTPPSGATQRPRGGRALRIRANRASKRVMLVSLAVSLTSGILRYKRWHIMTGWVFVGALAVHLWIYRRQLLR